MFDKNGMELTYTSDATISVVDEYDMFDSSTATSTYFLRNSASGAAHKRRYEYTDRDTTLNLFQ
jgi:hypothetical protein